MKLQDVVAVVTGASRGIGRATALALARAGADIVCTARSSNAVPSKLPGTIDDTAQQVRALDRRALAVRCDVSRQEQVDALAEQTLAEFGRIDILVNNAAVNPWRGAFTEMPMKPWDLVFNVNLRGAVLCTRAFLPRMLAQGSGRIINISSGAVTDPALTAALGIIPYAVSKAGLEALTQALAVELSPHHIAVNCVRIEMSVASEGATFLNPEVDYSGWEKPGAIAEAIAWMATRDTSHTGHLATIAEIRRAVAESA